MSTDTEMPIDTEQWPLESGLLGGGWHWPEADTGRVLLLLDGVRVRNLVFQLREWTGGRYYGDPLYAGTPFAKVLHLSPWLMELSGPDDPVLRRFLDHGLDAEWGYLLVSQATPMEVGKHLRTLLRVCTPTQGTMLLRVADPAVIAAVLPPERSTIAAPWGPIQRFIAPNGVTGQWRTWSPADDAGSWPALPASSDGLRLDAATLHRLHDCDRRTDLRHLASFVADHCPNWPIGMNRAERHARLDALTRDAETLGISSSQHWRLLCVLMASLRQTSLDAEAFPDAIREILSDPRQGDATPRLKAALASLRNDDAPADTPRPFDPWSRSDTSRGDGGAEADQATLDELLKGPALSGPASGHTT